MDSLTKPQRGPTPVRGRGAWAFLVQILGALCAAWLGGQAGRYVRLQADDLRPVVTPHLHVSGPTYLDSAKS